MLAKERLAYIIQRLQVRPSISVQDLSKEMNVSISTVQRDLKKLEAEGKIERARGGAVSNEIVETLSKESDVAVSEKVHIHQEEKETIAKTASQLIQEGECIFLDSGTTIAHLVPYIYAKNITIFTNSMYVHRKLIGCKGDVYLLGGKYSNKLDMTLGAPTLTQMESLRFDRAFLSASGLDIKSKEIYAVDDEIAIIKKVAIKRSKHAYLLVDHSKFKINAVHIYAKLSELDAIYTDELPENGKKVKNIIVCE